ncbi:TRM11 family SAM-dependent methyltransferase [Nocardia asiatica]|uniref:TRM11 family SAM-dependent methyltransferase n=1 Tax=Nocardia asiatica TaxID=209252 RepID=UPI000686F880|nr:methyltransferase [Nocardia asiatica]
MRYYVQFNAGLGELIMSSLRQDLKRVKVVFQDDSSAMLDSGARAEDVAGISYLKNAFLVLGETKRGAGLPGAIQALTSQLKRPEFIRLAPKKRPFRIMATVDGELVGLPRDGKSRLENAIAARTNGRVEARGSGVEYWIIGRRELGTFLFGLKLPKKKGAPTPKGALNAELAEMLVRAVPPKHEDVFLDPFAGRGSLVLARLKYPARRIIYSDIDYRIFKRDFQPELARTKRVQFMSEDALDLPSIADKSVDVVVTDPPWGEYEELDASYDEFAVNVARSLDRVLKPSGRFVVLINRRQEGILQTAFHKYGLETSAIHQILVNGHPASVLAGGRASIDSTSDSGLAR